MPPTPPASRKGTWQQPAVDDEPVVERPGVERQDTTSTQESKQDEDSSSPSQTRQASKEAAQIPTNMPVTAQPRTKEHPNTGHGGKQHRRRKNRSTPNPGHTFGTVHASNDVRIIFGNSGDCSFHENMPQHKYGETYLKDRVKFLAGDVSERVALEFMCGEMPVAPTAEPEEYESGHHHRGNFSARDFRK